MRGYRAFQTGLLGLIVVLSILSQTSGSKDKSTARETANENQPLTNLDKILRQTNNSIRVDNLMDNKLVSNLTNILNEMSQTMSKMIIENKRLTSQIQEVVNRVQNTTGTNAPITLGKLQQQAPNITSSINENIKRFGNIQSLARN